MAPGEIFNPYKLFNGVFIPFSLLASKDLSASAKLVYGRLTAYAGEDGLAYPSQETISQEIGLSRRGIQNALYELEEFKLIKILAPQGRDRLNHHTTKYIFLYHELLAPSSRENIGSFRTRKNCASGVENFAHPETQILRPVYKEEKNQILKESIKEKENNTLKGIIKEKEKIAIEELDNITPNTEPQGDIAIFDSTKHAQFNRPIAPLNHISQSQNNPHKSDDLLIADKPLANNADNGLNAFKSPRSKKTPLPEHFTLSSRLIAWGEQHSYSKEILTRHFDHFIDAAKARAYQYADWEAAFRNAVKGNWAKLPAEGKAIAAPANSQAPPHQPFRFITKGQAIRANNQKALEDYLSMKKQQESYREI